MQRLFYLFCKLAKLFVVIRYVLCINSCVHHVFLGSQGDPWGFEGSTSDHNGGFEEHQAQVKACTEPKEKTTRKHNKPPSM